MHTGLYEAVLTHSLREDIARLFEPHLIDLQPIDPDECPSVLAQFLEQVLLATLARHQGRDATARQLQLVERVLRALQEDAQGESEPFDVQLVNPLQRLLAIRPPGRIAERIPGPRPDTPLARSALLTGTRLDPGLGIQLRKELASADRVDILCSFVKWSGLRIILDELRALAERPGEGAPRIRLITTSYLGATDPRAVETLSKLPHTEIRVSYDTQRTRLHAKAYLIHRQTGFGSAYVGSANLSQAALAEGLEWTTKISQYELPYLWERLTGTFETYWQDDEFELLASDSDRLRVAIARERAREIQTDATYAFELHPYPFQEEILDVLGVERDSLNLRRHLIVAATGTGKTMVAAFDYARLCRREQRRPALLFVAHREEILRQALGTFRAVLRDQNFGDLLVGGSRPAQDQHLFCSIQSYNSQGLWQRPRDTFEHVVVDEFHHAAATSYRRLLEHVQPQILVGLTATPERADGLDILGWFGGRVSAEIRLPDAINRRLLCPFQYFGVSDSVDLDGLVWQRGGYRTEDLDRLYTGNDSRAALVVQKTAEIVLDPRRVHALAFCVSVAHAEYMASYFNRHAWPAMVVSGQSSTEERTSVRERLASGQINFVFVVDLYNEGVDLPEIDTVLFLRPTESLTVFLQQLGRGLRVHPDKECLTVLDFIGAQHREFRFAERFRALSSRPTVHVAQEIKNGFPHLPAGCVVQLERVAQERILENVLRSVRGGKQRIVDEIRTLAVLLGRPPQLGEVLDSLQLSLTDLLRRGSWSNMLAAAGQGPVLGNPDEVVLSRGIHRLSHLNDPQRLRRLLDHLRDLTTGRTRQSDARLEVELAMLHVSLWREHSERWDLTECANRLLQNPAAVHDLLAVCEWQLSHSTTQPIPCVPDVAGPLKIHALYTREEILVGLGHWSLSNRPELREGVLHVKPRKVDAFFVTLHKTEAEYSPTTMYEDYLISHELFHWQSQSTTSVDSPTGQRYLRHRELGYSPLLFVREFPRLTSGLSSPYVFLGPADLVSATGSRPMSIVWRLRTPVPAKWYREFARQAVG